MNRYSAPWRALPITLIAIYFLTSFTLLVLVVYTMATNTRMADQIGWIGAVVSILSMLGALVAYAFVVTHYSKPHLHTSQVKKIWVERRAFSDVKAGYPELVAGGTGVRTLQMMKLASSSHDKYRIDDSMVPLDTLKCGSIVTIMRRWGLNRTWHTTVVSVSAPPKDEEAVSGESSS